jgi:hypothetical protein
VCAYACTRACGFCSQEICVLILRDKSAGRICLFAPEQQQTQFFLLIDIDIDIDLLIDIDMT